jgi:hypothetical protein
VSKAEQLVQESGVRRQHGRKWPIFEHIGQVGVGSAGSGTSSVGEEVGAVGCFGAAMTWAGLRLRMLRLLSSGFRSASFVFFLFSSFAFASCSFASRCSASWSLDTLSFACQYHVCKQFGRYCTYRRDPGLLARGLPSFCPFSSCFAFLCSWS